MSSLPMRSRNIFAMETTFDVSKSFRLRAQVVPANIPDMSVTEDVSKAGPKENSFTVRSPANIFDISVTRDVLKVSPNLIFEAAEQPKNMEAMEVRFEASMKKRLISGRLLQFLSMAAALTETPGMALPGAMFPLVKLTRASSPSAREEMSSVAEKSRPLTSREARDVLPAKRREESAGATAFMVLASSGHSERPQPASNVRDVRPGHSVKQRLAITI